MKYLLIKASFDYADEFDCDSLGVMTEDDWIDCKDQAKEALKREGAEVGFGTNEALEISDYDEWLSGFQVIEISESAYKELLKALNPYDNKSSWITYGTGDGVFTL